MRHKLSRIGLAIVLALGLGMTACDKEDKADVKEVGNDIEKGVDDLDTDGKDD
jgi:hypothetical protein